MPVIKINNQSEVTSVANIKFPSTAKGSEGVIWVTDTQNDTTSDKIFDKIKVNGLDDNILLGGDTSRFVLLECGLDTTSVKGTAANRMVYIQSEGLSEKSYVVSYDNRFISTVFSGKNSDSWFSNGSMGTPSVAFTPTAFPSTTLQIGLEHYSTTTVPGVTDKVVYDPSYTTLDTDVSVIAGPRATACFLAFKINPSLGTEYTLYGTLNSSTALADATLVDYIDTTVYLQGTNTGVMIQIPLRIARLP